MLDADLGAELQQAVKSAGTLRAQALRVSTATLTQTKHVSMWSVLGWTEKADGGLVYVNNNKAASTSIRSILLPLFENRIDWATSGLAEMLQRRWDQKPTRLPLLFSDLALPACQTTVATNRHQWLNSSCFEIGHKRKRFFVFSFVRDPLQKFEAGAAELRMHPDEAWKHVQSVWTAIESGQMGEVFVNEMAHQVFLHLAPSMWHLTGQDHTGQVLWPDWIGRTEHFHSDWKEMLEVMGAMGFVVPPELTNFQHAALNLVNEHLADKTSTLNKRQRRPKLSDTARQAMCSHPLFESEWKTFGYDVPRVCVSHTAAQSREKPALGAILISEDDRGDSQLGMVRPEQTNLSRPAVPRMCKVVAKSCSPLCNDDASILRQLLLGNISALKMTADGLTCAIVGNSGKLLKQSLGAEIDAHGAVFRINSGPAGGIYTQHVGSRTSVRMNRAPLQNDGTFVIQVKNPPANCDYPEFAAVSHTQTRHCLHSMLNKTILPSQVKLSTGIIAIAVSAAVCNSITLFGFDTRDEFLAINNASIYGAPSHAPHPYHYYDSTWPGNPMRHDREQLGLQFETKLDSESNVVLNSGHDIVSEIAWRELLFRKCDKLRIVRHAK